MSAVPRPPSHAPSPGLSRAWLLRTWSLTFLALATLLVAAPARGQGYAVSTESRLATQAAMAQLQAGGNAVDAMVTATFVAGVASPTSSGIGGGGFALVWDAATQTSWLLDFRETAPKQLDAAAFERRPLPWAERGKLVGVPGEVAGLYQLHQRYGKRSWQQVMQPAIAAAQSGFPVEGHLARMLVSSADTLKQEPGLAEVFYPNGKPVGQGTILKNPKLAATLQAIAAGGPAAFYEGPIAEDMVKSVRAAGGGLTLEDLKAYRTIERTPLRASWEGFDVHTMPLPSAGGVLLLQTLALFNKAELVKLGFDSGAYQHLLAEGMRGAVADRMRYLGDPAVQPADLPALMAPERLAKRRASLSIHRTHMPMRFGLEGTGTHHLVTADAAGNMVSLTTTVNRLFGAKIVATESGVVMNDELDDFTAQASVVPYGMKQSPNRPRPGARPLSSMTPTIVVKDGVAVLGIGGSGGPTIPTNVTQLLLGRLAFDMPATKLVSSRRFYLPHRSWTLALEKGAPQTLFDDLARRGEIVGTMPFTTSAVQLISLEGRRKVAAADPRKGGFGAAR
ncbi:MAG: gamma-glutamyltransferase [Polyangiaceae bacterium]|nr:gamma-glutamyltransferase [Polyangiaceae bacterium]MCW5789779.1 gamma-glutamyltransferase [Polyangiaceae bacterium]